MNAEANSNARHLRSIIRSLAHTEGKDIPDIIMCKVAAVDEDSRTCTCTPINDKTSASIPDVQLMAVGNDGEIRIPAVDSYVIVVRMEKMQPFVIRESDLSKYLLVADSIQFNGDTYGGLVKAGVTAQKIVALETFCNTVASALGLPQPFPVPTTQQELENPNVQHG